MEPIDIPALNQGLFARLRTTLTSVGYALCIPARMKVGIPLSHMPRPLRLSASRPGYFCLLLLVLGFGYPLPGKCAPTIATPVESVETIIAIRHGEKPANSLGQLSCKGLNRSLALPSILLSRYGRPDFIFAPNPSVMSTSAGGTYSYVRPLATIEPTAIRAGLPVDTQIGLNDIGQLQRQVTSATYQNSIVFIAWEHAFLDRFAKALSKAYGSNPRLIPKWPENDYESVFVFQLRIRDGKRSVIFRHEYEGLQGDLSDACPNPVSSDKVKQVQK